MPRTQEEKTVYGCRVRVTKQDDHVVDVEVLVDGAQRKKFLRHFKQHDISVATNSYTGLVQQELTSYFRHHAFSSTHVSEAEGEKEEKIYHLMNKISDCLVAYVDLEKKINNASSIPPGEHLIGMQNLVEFFVEDLLKTLGPDESPNRKEFEKQLRDNVAIFIQHIESLHHKEPLTDQDLQQLFCSQVGAIDGSTSPCLGSFLTQQLFLLSQYGIEEVFSITGKRLELVGSHPAVKALSDAKAGLELRGLSAVGVREQNSQLPIPSALLDLVDSPEDDTPKRWLSLSQYIDQFQNIEEMDKMLFLLSGEPKESFHAAPVNRWLAAEVTFFTGVEILISLVHVAASLFSFGMEGVLWVYNLFPVPPLDMKKFDEKVSQLHDRASYYLHGAKNKLRDSYAQEKESDEKAFLETLWGNSTVDSTGSLNGLLSYYSGHRLATMLGDFVRSSIDSVSKHSFSSSSFNIPWIFWFSPKQREKASKEKRMEKFKEKANQTYADYNALTKKMLESLQKTTLSQAQSMGSAESKNDCWAPGVPWVPNAFDSVFDFPAEIASALSDDFIGKMFRHNPGPATFSSMLSMASFSVLMSPALTANANMSWLGWFPHVLSKHISGKSVINVFDDAASKKLISVFLQWKVLVLSSEVAPELYHGDIEFLRSTFKDLHKIMLVLAFLGCVGTSLEFLQDIPTVHLASLADHHALLQEYLKFTDGCFNVIPKLVSQLGEESFFCNQLGTVGLNWSEDLLLGLKFCFLLHSMLHSSDRASVVDIDKVARQLVEEAKLQGDMTQGSAKKLLEQHGIEEPSDERSRLLYDQLIQVMINANQELDVDASAEQKAASVEEKSTAFEAHKNLEEAMLVVSNMESLGSSGFKDKESAWYFSDYLTDCFDAYIEALEKNGVVAEEERRIKKEYMAHFDNKYCENHPNRLVKFFSIYPLYLITVLWRGLIYFFSDSACTKNKIIRDFKRDVMMHIQFVTALARPVRALIRTLTYVLRVAVALIAIVAISPELLRLCIMRRSKDAGNLVSRILEGVAKTFNFHRASLPGWSWLKAKYAKWTADCNVSQEKAYLDHSREQLRLSLEKNKFLVPAEEMHSTDEQSTVNTRNHVNFESGPAITLIGVLGYMLKAVLALIAIVISIPELFRRCVVGKRQEAVNYVKGILEWVGEPFHFDRISVPGWSWLKAKYVKWTADDVSQKKEHVGHSNEKISLEESKLPIREGDARVRSGQSEADILKKISKKSGAATSEAPGVAANDTVFGSPTNAKHSRRGSVSSETSSQQTDSKKLGGHH